MIFGNGHTSPTPQAFTPPSITPSKIWLHQYRTHSLFRGDLPLHTYIETKKITRRPLIEQLCGSQGRTGGRGQGEELTWSQQVRRCWLSSLPRVHYWALSVRNTNFCPRLEQDIKVLGVQIDARPRKEAHSKTALRRMVMSTCALMKIARRASFACEAQLLRC